MTTYRHPNIRRVLMQLLFIIVAISVIVVLQLSDDVSTFLGVPAVATLAVWCGGAFIKNHTVHTFTDTVFTSFFTTMTGSYGVILLFAILNLNCFLPNSLFSFLGAFAGFYLPFVIKSH